MFPKLFSKSYSVKNNNEKKMIYQLPVVTALQLYILILSQYGYWGGGCFLQRSGAIESKKFHLRIMCTLQLKMDTWIYLDDDG